MSVIVQLYNVGKRRNSDFRPPTEGRFTVNCELKEDSSVLHPRILLASVDNTWNPTNYNFARIDNYNDRYYFIDNWTYVNGYWQADMSVDVLASFKDEIITKNFYILRTSTASDGDIEDKMYPAKSTPQRGGANGQFWYSGSYSLGCVVMSLIGKDASTSFVACDYVQWLIFCKNIFGNMDWANISESDINEVLAKMVVDPFHYINSVTWFPVWPQNRGEEMSTISFGYWDIGVAEFYKLLDTPVVDTITKTINLLAHPQAASRGTFLNHPPYLQGQFICKPFGTITLDFNEIAVGTPLTAEVQIDFRSGIAQLTLSQNGTIKNVKQAQIGCPIPLNDVSPNIIGAVEQGAGAASSALTGNFLGMLQGIGNAISNIGGKADSAGSQGSTINYDGKYQVVEYSYLLVDEDNADNGRPYCKNGTVEQLGDGFYVVENGNVSIATMLNDERRLLQDLLEGGFYHES